jgi:hypothetical protein
MLTIHHPLAVGGYIFLGVLALGAAHALMSPEHFDKLAQYLANVALSCVAFSYGRLRTRREHAELKAMADAAERRAAAAEQEEKEHAAARARLMAMWTDPLTRLDAIVVFFRETEHLIPRVASVLALPKLSDVVAKVEAHAAQATVLGLDRDAVAQLMTAVDAKAKAQ